MAIILLASCSQEELQPENYDSEESSNTQEIEANPYEEGVSIVKFDDEMMELIESDLNEGKLATRSMGLNQALDELGITSMKRLFPDAGEFEPRTRKAGLHKWYIVEYSKDVARTRADAEFESIDGIDMVEGKRKLKSLSFNDPYFSNQWGMNLTSAPNYNINVVPVWQNYTTGSSNVIVSVVDAGIDLDHEDLAGNIASASLHYDSVSGTSGTSQITAGDHGTHVAGVVAAVNNNDIGVCGVAGGDYANGVSGVQLMSCQIFKTVGNETVTGNSAEAIKWGADHGAVISQNSWGYDFDYDGNGSLQGTELSDALAAEITTSEKEAVDYFITYAGCDNDGNQLSDSPMKGGVVIFAAGNDGIENGAPANYEPIIAVGAMNKQGGRTTYSNYGDFVDIAAPGSDIYSTIPDSKYYSMSGTSMACPHVSGVAALIVSYYGGQGFTNENLKERLLNGSNSKPTSGMHIGGLVDALGAITYGNTAAPGEVTDLEGEVSSNNVTLSWTATADTASHPAYGYIIIYGTDSSVVSSARPGALNGASSVTVTDVSSAGDSMSKAISDLGFQTSYFFKIYAYSYNMLYSEASQIITVVTDENNPPVIETTYTGTSTLKSFESISVPVTITDPDGHSFTTSYASGSDADSFSNNTITIVGSKADAGQYTAVITATDSYGSSSEFSFVYTILENNPPEVLTTPENMLITNIGETITMDMTEYFEDPDGETLKYTIAYSNSNIVNFNPQGTTLVGSTISYGLTTVTITASDARSETATISFQILVREASIKYVVYPNPVTTNMYISTGEDLESAQVKIYSQTGTEIFNDTVQASAFEPATIDLSNIAPGRYSFTIKLGSEEYNQEIVKK